MQDHVLDTGHGDLEKVGVGCVGEVNVDVLDTEVSFRGKSTGYDSGAHLLGVAVKALEVVLKERGCVFVRLWISRVFREVLLDWSVGEFLLKQVDLVEEEDDGCPNKPLRVAYTLEQHQSFLHLVLRPVCQYPTIYPHIRSNISLPHLYPPPDIDRIRL